VPCPSRYPTPPADAVPGDPLALFVRGLPGKVVVEKVFTAAASAAHAAEALSMPVWRLTDAASVSAAAPWSIAPFATVAQPPADMDVENDLFYAQLAFPDRTERWSVGKILANVWSEHGIQVPHLTDVHAYLESHRDLAAVVATVCARAREVFGIQAELTLRVYRDPEIDDRHLSLIVRLPTYDAATMGRLDRVTETLEEELCSASGYLLVTTDFRPVRAKYAV
jgi:hypothetical protein